MSPLALRFVYAWIAVPVLVVAAVWLFAVHLFVGGVACIGAAIFATTALLWLNRRGPRGRRRLR